MSPESKSRNVPTGWNKWKERKRAFFVVFVVDKGSRLRWIDDSAQPVAAEQKPNTYSMNRKKTTSSIPMQCVLSLPHWCKTLANECRARRAEQLSGRLFILRSLIVPRLELSADTTKKHFIDGCNWARLTDRISDCLNWTNKNGEYIIDASASASASAPATLELKSNAI